MTTQHYLKALLGGSLALFSCISIANGIVIPGGSFTRDEPFILMFNETELHPNTDYQLTCYIENNNETPISVKYEFSGFAPGYGIGYGSAYFNNELTFYPQFKVFSNHNELRVSDFHYEGNAALYFITDEFNYTVNVNHCTAK